MFAWAKDGERAVAAGDGRAARSGLALVAGHRGVAEVHAPRSLEQVAGRRGHIAKLCRCAGEKGLRQNWIISYAVFCLKKKKNTHVMQEDWPKDTLGQSVDRLCRSSRSFGVSNSIREEPTR